MLARGQAISRIYHITPKIQLDITRTSLASPVNTMARRKTCNALSVLPAWARTHEAKLSPRTLGVRVAEVFHLVVAAALPTALISYCSSSSHPPNNEYISTLSTTPCTSLPPFELTQLQALCGTEHRAFVPPFDLNRPDVVPLNRGRPSTLQRCTY